MNVNPLRGIIGISCIAGALCASPAWSATGGSGSGFGLQTSLSAVPLLGLPTTLNLGPAPSGVSGTAPPDFNQSGTTVSIAGSLLGGGVNISSGTLNASTQSTLLANTVSSSASVENLNLGLTLAGLQASAVTSQATATCNAGSVVVAGESQLTGVQLAGLLLGLSVAAKPAPNTVLINVLGIKITLNEQIVVGKEITVNAIHVALNNWLLTGLGVLSGDIYVARSVAAMTNCALPDLAMAKSGPANATVGAAFAYTLSVSNVGALATSGTITVTDTVPAALAINSVTNGANFNCGTNGQLVTCTSNTSIAAGASNVPVATINVTPTQAGQVSNTAVVSGGGDNSPGNNTSPPANTNVSAAPSPDLAMAKSGPPNAVVGVSFAYTLTLSNIGNGASNGTITVSDSIPAGLTINNVANGANFSCGTNAQAVTCTSNAAIAAGASSVPVATISVTATQAGQVSNTAVVSGGGDNTPGNNTSPPTNTNVSAAPSPDLAMAKSGPANAAVGVAFAYTLSVSNVGTGATSGAISVSDTVPAGLTINNVANGANFSCGTNAQVVTCTSNAAIAAGANNVPVATINVTPTQAGQVSNTAVVSGGGDNSPGNNTSPPTNTNVSAAPAPDLTITLTGPPNATVGTAFAYTLTIANVGTGPTSGTVTVADAIPAGLTIGSIVNGPNFSCGANGQTVTCTTNAVVAAGASNVLAAVINVTPTQAGQVSNTATVSGGGDNSPGNNTSPPVNTNVSALSPDLAIGKSGPANAAVGVPFNYQLTLANIGNGPTSGIVTVTDTLSSSLTINTVTSGSGFSCNRSFQTVTCTTNSPIASGASNVAVVTITVTPKGTGSISNTATVSGGGDNSPGNNTSPPVGTEVSDQLVPNLAMNKIGPLAVFVGVGFTYRLELANIGNGPTSGVITVTDVVPAGLTIASVQSGANFLCTLADRTVTCTSSQPIPAGATGVIVGRIGVEASAPGLVSNKATVVGGGDDTPANNESPPVVTDVSSPPAAIAPTSLDPQAVPTLSEYMLILLILCVGLAAWFSGRRRMR